MMEMDHNTGKLSISHIAVPETPGKIAAWKTIPQVLRHYAEQCPDKEAVVFVSSHGGRVAVTFKELYEKSKTVAHNLVTLGVKEKEIVAINLRSCPEWLYIHFGSMMAGALSLGASFTYKDGSDIVALMGKLGTCSCLVIDPGYGGENWNSLSKLIDEYSPDGRMTSRQLPSLRYLLCHDPEDKLSGVMSFSELLIDPTSKPGLPELQENDLAVLFQTSGSTGIPKVVAHTHASILTTATTTSGELNTTGTTLSDRPFCWIGGYPSSLFRGATRITLSGIYYVAEGKAKCLMDVVAQEKCDDMIALPALLHQIIEMFDLGEDMPVTKILTGGQPITKQMVSSCIGTVCEQMIIGYGGTEFLVCAVVTVSGSDNFINGTCGQIIPGVEVKIVDPEGKTLPLDTQGEIYIKSKSVFREYYNDPEKTAAAFTEDGWYKTDDLGRFLEDGSLVVEGRKSNMIISGGMNVAPEILEAAINKCPGIESCVVVPVSDDFMYQVICACIKIVPGSDVDETVVKTFCEEAHGDKLGLFTVMPSYYLFLDSFPETRSGKVARKNLAILAERKFRK